MDLDPAALSPADRYKLLIGGIVPRPIAWVSTISPTGALNLAPFSFFAGVGSVPMTLLFCPANKDDGTPKDTLKNLLSASESERAGCHEDSGRHGAAPSMPRALDASAEGTEAPKQFVVNTVPFALRREMSASAEPLPYEQSEFATVGLTPIPSTKVRPPRVAGSPLAFECDVLQVIRLAPGAPGGANIVIGRVVHVHAVEGLVNARHHVDPAVLDSIGRMGGNTYCTSRDRFDVARGLTALKSDS